MTTQNIRAAFEKFEALGDWMTTELPPNFYDWYNVLWNIGGPTGCHLNNPEITLNYEVKMRLEDIRLEVTELVFGTYILSLETTIRIQRAAYDGLAAEQTVSKLFDLRARVVVSLSSLLDTLPARKNDQCPRIWADGHLRIREAEFGLDGETTHTAINVKIEGSKLKEGDESLVDRFELGRPGRTWRQDRQEGYTAHGHPRPVLVPENETLLWVVSFFAQSVKRRGQSATLFEETRDECWRLCCETWKEVWEFQSES
jgi:hypothetical protein